MNIVLDERESLLIQKFRELNNEQVIVPYSTQLLPLGDVLIQKDGNDVFLIERKTLSDLLASIKDGRYEEQSYRFCHSVPLERHHIIYLIEGSLGQLKTSMEKKIVYSAIVRLQAFKGFSVIRMTNSQESCDYIISLYDKTKREMEKGSAIWSANCDTSEPVKDYCSVVKKVKKDNITKENIDEILLCQIPGVNNISAKTVLEKFGNMFTLMSEIRKDVQCLNGIMVESKGKTRKLAKNVIQNIVHYLGA